MTDSWEVSEIEISDLWSPVGLAIDSDGFVYVYDTPSDLVRKFTGEGDHIEYSGGGGNAPG